MKKMNSKRISSTLSPPQKYAAGALLALALRQSQIHQTHPLGSSSQRPSSSSSSSSFCDDDDGDPPSSDDSSWTHESRGLLRPVFRFLEIDDKAWPGLEETAASSDIKHHIGAYLRLIEEEEESEEESSEISEQKFALAKGVEAMAKSLGASSSSFGMKNDNYCHRNDLAGGDQSTDQFNELCGETSDSMMGDIPAKYQRKISFLFELLSACVADTPQDGNKASRNRKGYDARHRVALRLLSTWLNVRWIQMEAMEIMVACSAMAAAKEDVQSQENESTKSKWSKWKRGGIIGAAALTGGTLLAITGGLAAPAIAAGFGALAPTLGTLVPVIGASGFAAVASAAGSVAGSVAVAASFGAAGAGLSGTKMARRMGSIEEFEFKPIGENHNQGHLAVGILVSGFVFEVQDFVRPWEGCEDNLERSDKAGKLLAEVLLKGLQGNRPVTLIGFSLGARVIFKCLQHLAESCDNEGLIERVVLLGAPIPLKDEQWATARRMVAGRFVNVYSTNDWILGVTFRASLLTQGLAGIQAVDVPGIENVDVTHLIDGHSSYLGAVQQIVTQLEIDTYYPVFNCAPSTLE